MSDCYLISSEQFFQPCYGESKLHLDVMMMISDLCLNNTLSWIFIVLHLVHILMHALAEKQQIPIFYSLV